MTFTNSVAPKLKFKCPKALYLRIQTQNKNGEEIINKGLFTRLMRGCFCC